MAESTFAFVASTRDARVDVQVENPEESWGADVTVLRTNVSERPFIIDSIREYLGLRGHVIERMVYPILDVERGSDGALVGVRAPSDGGAKESIVHCEITRLDDAARREELLADLTSRLQDVVRATDDFQPMLDVLDVVVEAVGGNAVNLPDREAEFEEIQDFLRWLKDGGFVFLGYRDTTSSRTSIRSRPSSSNRRVDSGSSATRAVRASRSRFACPRSIPACASLPSMGRC